MMDKLNIKAILKAGESQTVEVSKARSRGEKLIDKDQYLWNLLK